MIRKKNTYPKPIENMINKKKIFWTFALKIKGNNKIRIKLLM